MGQYHIIVNLDKKEFLDPYQFGCGLKAWEQWHPYSYYNRALYPLLMCSNGRGGGDLPSNEIIGRWTGDHIAVVGDYAEKGDISGFNAESIYNEVFHEENSNWTDISYQVAKYIESTCGVRFKGDGWKDTVKDEKANQSELDGDTTTKLMCIDMLISKPRT